MIDCTVPALYCPVLPCTACTALRFQVLYRLYLAEKLKEPFRKGSRRPDAALLAARDAARLEAEQVRHGFCQPQCQHQRQDSTVACACSQARACSQVQMCVAYSPV
jgi:hypothetical protein